jgi:hypothetical protein
VACVALRAQCFDPEADDVAGLHRHYNTLWQPAHEEQGARQLEIAPYRRIVGLLMAIENLAGIASIGHDHVAHHRPQTERMHLPTVSHPDALSRASLACVCHRTYAPCARRTTSR